eukprot:TRINITY_DN7008_c5_g2_i1.p1 TRINITY_DN7008_c5_g2~~TRINITY_DN7008_c5_g2_i1.p1  ORF type:complete len:938 (+),score=167.75 TRINITY_DN7008_c5_g2_i1:72-2885(+)
MPMLISLLGCVLAGYPETPSFVNAGTPGGVPPSYDCTVREHAWNYAKALHPSRGDFPSLFDALQLQACGLSPPQQHEDSEWKAPKYETPADVPLTLFCDANAQKSGDGSISSPFQTISEALAAVEKRPSSQSPAIINLREGTFYLSDQLLLTPAHSNLTIQNYNGENVTVSGGVPLSTPKQAWKKDLIIEEHWETVSNMNNVHNKVTASKNKTDIKFLGTYQNGDDCALVAKGGYESWSWYSANYSDQTLRGQCFGSLSSFWAPAPDPDTISSRKVKSNRWSIDLSDQPLVKNLLGLRLNTKRAIRAKYPNGDPEQSGVYYQPSQDYTKGWASLAQKTKWVEPIKPKKNATRIVITAEDWPGVEWPMEQEGGSTWTGEGQWGEYHVGLGGYCDSQGLDPPFGYWCTLDAPRAPKLYFRIPAGIYIDGAIPQAVNYSKPNGAVIQSWRGMGGRWFSNLCLIDSFDKETGALLFDHTTGCNHGGEGEDSGAQWWIENVKEECDDDNEFYFDPDDKILYYNFNGTSEPTGFEQFVGVQTKVLFNISASQQKPAQNINIRGLTIRDAALTYLGHTAADVHGFPTGGDWAIQRSAAITIEGCELCAVADNKFTRIDGNGVILLNYNRNVSITNNDMSWIGDTAFATWGTTGTCLNQNCSKSIPYPYSPDARNGNQPWYTLLQGNVVREVGVYEKQSSFYNQAAAGFTTVRGNIFFNGPRAGINFQDGLMGGDILEGNFFANCVRESGDHGPFNSWDRVPYLTNFGMHRVFDKANITGDMPGHVLATGPSILSQFRVIKKNFILAVYNSQEAIDNDDGSCHYLTHDNYFVYATYGLKSDFGGQWNHHYNNIYAYVGGCYGHGNNDAFYDNLCQTRGNNGYTSTCASDYPPTMTIKGNRVHNPSGVVKFCEGDVNSTASTLLSDQDLDSRGANILKPWPMSMDL